MHSSIGEVWIRWDPKISIPRNLRKILILSFRPLRPNPRNNRPKYQRNVKNSVTKCELGNHYQNLCNFVPQPLFRSVLALLNVEGLLDKVSVSESNPRFFVRIGRYTFYLLGSSWFLDTVDFMEWKNDFPWKMMISWDLMGFWCSFWSGPASLPVCICSEKTSFSWYTRSKNPQKNM